MQKPNLPPCALITSGALHLVTSFLWDEVRRHEANFVEKGESGIDSEELEEYQRLITDLERLYETGVQVFEIRPWVHSTPTEAKK